MKSKHFPNEVVAARKGSPLIMGIRSSSVEQYVAVNNIRKLGASTEGLSVQNMGKKITETMMQSGAPSAVEYFLASDINALVEHTKKVLFLEDDDLVHFSNGMFHFYNRAEDSSTINSPTLGTREVKTIDMELAEITKGTLNTYLSIN
jgi:glucosamine--fructose-6-phosphate aminotransferase (isomerizing)